MALKVYYTIFLGDKLYEGGVDDMNTTAIWAEHGMVWDDIKKVEACIDNLKRYDIETEDEKFRIVGFIMDEVYLGSKNSEEPQDFTSRDDKNY